METTVYKVKGKTCTLYLSAEADKPLIVINNFRGNAESVVKEAAKLGAPEYNLLCVSDLNWDDDMTPWYCPPLSKMDSPCFGRADAYLDELLNDILPIAKEKVSGTPAFLGLCGYSLAGLFAVYAMYKCDVFDRVGSMSGSLWFPDFKDYVLTHELMRAPDKLYISLGDKEAKSRNELLKTVQDHTETIVEHYKGLGLDVTWELNPGNHFRDPSLRSAKGLIALLS